MDRRTGTPSSPAEEPPRERSIRAAATVVLLRPGQGGFDVLLTERARNLRFMGGATVFPGGAVAPADLDPAWAGATAGSPNLGARVCALREAFEEVGWVIGSGPIEELCFEDAVDPERWLRRCLELGIRLATDQLVEAGRWVTPLGSPVRFDTSFFVTKVARDFIPRLNGREVGGYAWRSPAEALDDLAAGKVVMAPPTIEMLQRLSAYEDADAAIAALAEVSDGGRVLTARLSPLVQVVLAPNSGLMTGPGTNTYVVGAGRDHAVLDVAAADEGYLDAVENAAGHVAAILVTHRHPDHVGGVAALASRTGAPVVAFSSAPAGEARVDEIVEDDSVVEAAGVRLRALHTPGHAPDHVCWLLEGTASLFSGDNILGEGTAVISPPDGDMAAYLRSLRRLDEFDIQRIYPGHWRALDGGNEVIRAYITHRLERQEAILATLKTSPRRPEDIVAEVYADTAPELHRLARQSVIAHLRLLEDEGLVAHEGEQWTRTTETYGRGGATE